MEATTNMVAAVVKPLTPPVRAWRIDPAPIKPIPGMICAAMRVWSPANAPASSLERMVNMAAPKQINIFVRSPAGLRLSSRSSPIKPPSAAASSRRARSCCKIDQSMCGRKNRMLFIIQIAGKRPSSQLSAHCPIDDSPCSGGSADCGNSTEPLGKLLYRAGHAVAGKGDDVVGRLRRTGERLLPVGRIALTQHAAKRYPRKLHRAGMSAAVHHERGRLWQLLEFLCQRMLKGHS